MAERPHSIMSTTVSRWSEKHEMMVELSFTGTRPSGTGTQEWRFRVWGNFYSSREIRDRNPFGLMERVTSEWIRSCERERDDD